ncbi:MAG: hypothetical protein Q9173_004853 [Seirophora scorigena]
MPRAEMPQSSEDIQGLRQLFESLENPDIFAPPVLNPPRSHTHIPQPGAGVVGWHELQGSQNSPNAFVPDTPPPRTQESGNDTPTPAIPMTGSWRHRRRTGEHVERPPQFRAYSPNAELSTSREIRSPDTVIRYNPRGPSNPQDSSRSSSWGTGREQNGEAQEPDDPIESAPFARTAPHPSQLDGVLEEGVQQGRQRQATLCKKLCKSIRNIPSQLAGVFSKENKGPPIDEPTGEAPRADVPEAADRTWWFKTSKPFGKTEGQGTASIGGRKRRRYGRKSLRGLFSSTEAAGGSSEAAQAPASGTTGPFDDSSAPQAFGAPRHEEDSNSPVGLDLGVNTEQSLDRQVATAWVLDAARANSSNGAPPSPPVDGNQEEQASAQPRGTWHLARRLYRTFLETNGWVPHRDKADDSMEATTAREVV